MVASLQQVVLLDEVQVWNGVKDTCVKAEFCNMDPSVDNKLPSLLAVSGTGA